MENRTPLITRGQLITGLRELGVAAGQAVMLHASVRSVGWVVGGPDVILQSLLDVLGPEGTLIMYTSWEEWENALVSYDSMSEKQQRVYREECPPFDPYISRANRKWSILTEYLRTWSGAQRSDHPTASVCAVGALAEWITADHPLNYGYGHGSPWDKLCQKNGKVLLLGSPLESVTLLHYAEHICNVPGKTVVHNQVPLLFEGQRVWTIFEEFDTTWGIRDQESSEYFSAIMGEYLASGSGQHGTVGGANAYLLDAAHLASYAVAWMEKAWKE